MQLKDAAQLRKDRGDEPCDHPNIEKEYYLGAQTGDYVCTSCGKAGWGPDWNKKPEDKSEDKSS